MKYIFVLIILFFASNNFIVAQNSMEEFKAGFQNPPLDCWPHTRWWWPGNAVTKEEITWELEQMRSVGIRGVEQITMSPFYEKGNISYLSDEFMGLVKHTVKEVKRLQMEVSFNFGGPGWIIGGEWVADEHKSMDMIPTFVDIEGPVNYSSELPRNLIRTSRSWEIYDPELSGTETLLAVVAGKIDCEVIDESTLTVLTVHVEGSRLTWDVPEGNWRIMAFWLAINKSHDAVNHFDKASMEYYCNYFGGKFKEAVGDEFGKSLDSFFADSFELPYLASGIKWSRGLLKEFNKRKGYNLTGYLPAIWWDVGNVTSGIRYDVNEFLHEIGTETFFETFTEWCRANGIKSRVQTYGFETDNIQSAGMVDIPEMEITPGEKDQHPWFDTRIGPKKYVASGAHIYGRDVISVEAFTFLHWERYRATMEEVKIAADGFLRSGATKFYNHGFSFSHERDLAPSRRLPWAPQINPTNIWWKYYPKLTQYIARCSYMLRQGSFAPDIAIYSPLANQWTKNVLNARRWTRDFDWGELGNLLISNGYDFDLLNDDALQNIAEFENSNIKIRNMEYKVLLIPNIESMPLETLLTIERYVEGGGVVVALDRLPQYSTGFLGSGSMDMEVEKIVSDMFGSLNGKSTNASKYGQGKTHYLKKVIHREIWWDQYSSALDPFLKILKKYIEPDFNIDFAYEGIRKNDGLTFLHRKLEGADVYFVSNIQSTKSKIPVTFRVKGRTVWEWNPFDGNISQLFQYKETNSGIQVPLELEPYESTILIFESGEGIFHVNSTNLIEITGVSGNEVTGLAGHNGSYFVEGSGGRAAIINVAGIPSPLEVNGNWKLTLESAHFPKLEMELDYLTSWTDMPAARHFSGTGRYEIEVNLPAEYFTEVSKLVLELGRVNNIAEVEVNGREAGVVWMQGQTVDITGLVKPGNNTFTIWVTNTNINRVSAFTEPVPVPEELTGRFGKVTAERLPREFGFDALPASGLLGPVKIIPYKEVSIIYN